ncbi:hypothetical protein SAMN06296036_102169 [Pseudobacteriovorax antillogorgiicola]|uniref:VWFA domain-containing protein n=2 Tax=Pseudobacteriovorax antillogorgiicola TaxID=1513793 RepID=A0A1Y6BB63_9BACT|nr:hypothetical protein EDD56_102274 [Pseudobacteriovorax antillogorgiicola]SME95025.1 hypothetical protein SAMN06296036_102169 [Pseudobacteriovorax antillogorgiicola]
MKHLFVLVILILPAIFQNCSDVAQFAGMRSVGDPPSAAGGVDDTGIKPDTGDSDVIVEVGPNPIPSGAYKNSIQFNCGDDSVHKERIDLSEPSVSSVELDIEGFFCPKQVDNLHVLLLMDFSGSMGLHRTSRDGPLAPGNDPQAAENCGRLESTIALLETISAQKSIEDKVKIAMVPFAGQVVEDFVIEFVDMEEFYQNLSANNICRYIVQDHSFGLDPTNPGALSRERPQGKIDASTNYRAAFEGAEEILKAVEGRKVVYMISDGYPTSGGRDPIEISIDAGERLRDKVSNMTLNAILLGAGTQKAQELLEYVAGSKERVRAVASASQLADEIVVFPPPEIDPETALASYASGRGDWQDLDFTFFEDLGGGQWQYQVKTTTLDIEAGTDIQSISVRVLGFEGTSFEHRVEIELARSGVNAL